MSAPPPLSSNQKPPPHLPRAHFAAGPREAQIGPAPGRAGPEGARNLAARTCLARSAPPPSRRRRRPTPATGARRRPSSTSPSAACIRSPASAPVSSFLLWLDLSLTSLSLFSPQDLPPPPREALLDVGGPHRCRERRPRPVLHRIRPVLAVPAAVLLPSRLAGASRCTVAAVPRSRSDREEDNAPVGPASWALPFSPAPRPSNRPARPPPPSGPRRMVRPPPARPPFFSLLLWPSQFRPISFFSSPTILALSEELQFCRNPLALHAYNNS